MAQRSAPISCSDVADLLPAIADGQIEADDAPDIFEHLAGCSACQEELTLHDLCSLALAGEQTPSKEPARVIQYSIPRWLSLPLAAAACLAIVVLLRGLGENNQANSAAIAEQRQQVEILQIIPPAPGQQHPRYLVRVGGPGGETRWVDPTQLDDTGIDASALHMGGQVPVGFQQR